MAKDDKEPEDDVNEDGEEGDEDGGGKKAGKKKKLLFIGLGAALVLLLITVAALMFLGGGKEEEAEQDGTETAQEGEGNGDAKEEHAADPVFYELPAIYANIINDDGETSVLKLIILLEVADEETVQKIEPLLPRIVDRYQGFLRELRMEDVKGSAGYYRLKLELLRRVNQAVAPVHINDLTIDTLLVN